MDYGKWPDKRQITIYFRGFLCAAFIMLLIFGLILKWTMLTKMMCLSCAACFAIFTYTAVKEKTQAGEKEKAKGFPDRRKTVQPKKLK